MKAIQNNKELNINMISTLGMCVCVSNQGHPSFSVVSRFSGANCQSTSTCCVGMGWKTNFQSISITMWACSSQTAAQQDEEH